MILRTRIGRQCMSVFFLSFAALAAHASATGAHLDKVRPAAVAGSFYPADPTALTGMMDAMMARTSLPVLEGPIVAVMAPHAGYEYSGPVAAYTYAALRQRHYARVIVIAPSHFEAFGIASVFGGDAYSTPLGTIPIDKEFVQHLARMDPGVQISDRGHVPGARAAEHALEVQLPWLQRSIGSFKLVPIVMGDQSYESSRALAVAIAKLAPDPLAEGGTLVVASSDLSHYHPQAEAQKIDQKMLRALTAWDYFTMARNFNQRVWEACGGGPVITAMMTAERWGANDVKLLRYGTTAEVTGDRSRVVGYGSVALIKSRLEERALSSFALTQDEKDELLAVARASVEHAVRERTMYKASPSADSVLNQECGAFVTLRTGGQLRGCIGYTSAAKPLYETVRDTAMLAALEDPRFPSVKASELDGLEYEVSVLSPLRRVRDIAQIRIGEHGLLIKNGSREGLLLPQVAQEQHWGRVQYLEQTCMKAGLPTRCWMDEGTDVFAFTAVVFADARVHAMH